MKKRVIVGFSTLLVIFLLSFIGANDCQYKEYVESNKTISNLYVNGIKQTNPLEIKNDFSYYHGLSGTGVVGFDVFNNIDYPINVRVEFLYDRGTTFDNLEIPAHEFGKITRAYNGPRLYISLDTIELKLQTNNYTEVRWEKEYNEVCKLCRIEQCFNDGTLCNYSFECGGGYCIEGICLNENDTFDLVIEFEENISRLHNDVSLLMSWKQIITDSILDISTSITELFTKTDNHEDRIIILEDKTLILQNQTFPNYLNYLSSSDRKKIVCGYAEENRLTHIEELGYNCDLTYRTYSSGRERISCRCKIP